MTLLWTFQILLDLFVVAILVKFFILRGRRRSLLHLHEAVRDQSENFASPPVQGALNTPLGSALSTLSEKRNQRGMRDSALSSDPMLSEDSSLFGSQSNLRVRDAKRLLNQGLSLSEVSSKTGLSHAELALLEKTILGGMKDLQ